MHSAIALVRDKLKRLSGRTLDPEEVLVIAPHCLQSKDCTVDLRPNTNACRQCGDCACKELLGLTIKHGVRTLVADGDQQAILATRTSQTELIIAVGPEAELASWTFSSIATPVVRIPYDGNLKGLSSVFGDIEAAIEDAL